MRMVSMGGPARNYAKPRKASNNDDIELENQKKKMKNENALVPEHCPLFACLPRSGSRAAGLRSISMKLYGELIEGEQETRERLTGRTRLQSRLESVRRKKGELCVETIGCI